MSKPKVKVTIRTRRIFSDELKRKLVKDIEEGKVSVSGVSREYLVSNQAIYAWLPKFSSSLSSSKSLVVQMDSEQYKTKELQRQVLELQAALGRKQMEVDYLNKVIDIAGNDLGIDLKKNTSLHVSDGSLPTSKKSDLP